MPIATRLRALETRRARQHGKSVRVIHRGADETDEQAIQREGVALSGELLVIIVSFVEPGQLLRLPSL